jgi:DNA-binding response OmpR family regulator
MHKILIIDDEKINTALVKFNLSEKGYEVIQAQDGAEGIERVKEFQPDLIILDIQMPFMNGYEFMAELKRIQGVETTPVIMLTANETMEDIFKMEGVKDYFVKPVPMDQLFTRIVALLGENTP